MVYFGTGFTAKSEIICTKFDMKVDPDDGCTFGFEGESSHKPINDSKIDNIDPIVFSKW